MEGCPPLAASTRPDSSGLDAVESRPVDSFATLRSGLPCAPPRRPARQASRAASAGARSSTDQSPLVWHLPRCRITELSRRKKVPSCGKSPGAGGASASVCSQEANLNLSVPKRHCQGQRGTHAQADHFRIDEGNAMIDNDRHVAQFWTARVSVTLMQHRKSKS